MGGEADQCLKECMGKLDKALSLDEKCHEALSVYGSALNATAFAQVRFPCSAFDCFRLDLSNNPIVSAPV